MDFHNITFPNQMTHKLHKVLLVLIAVFAMAAAEEWYEQGHHALLTWENFDSTVNRPNAYKFVKFFTHNCRYCRMIKQVEEELRAQKQWSFQFYQVDCTNHYDLCAAKATITGFPYVGIYNGKGELAGKLGGYYPIQTMREAFTTIQEWQAAEQANTNKTIEQPKVVANQQIKQQTSTKTEEKVTKTEEKVTKTEQKVSKPEEKAKTEQKVSMKTQRTSDQSNQGWSESIKDGIRMSLILGGVLLFNKIISPYFSKDQQQSASSPHIIQIPISTSTSQQAVKQPYSNNYTTTFPINDSL